MTDVSLADYEWLVSAAANEALARAAELHAAKTNLVQCVQTLRREYSAARAHLLLENVELRRRGAEKFSHAAEMFFTRTGLEQATDEQIARSKAARFPPGEMIADWCSGIGGDLFALAARGEWCGVDRDPVMRLIAAKNVAVANGIDFEEARQKLHAEISIEQVSPEGFWHLDPDRRASGGRSVRMESFSPPLEFIQQVIVQRSHGALKIAPASDIPQEWNSTAEREWISRGGECRQQVVWFGKLARHPAEHAASIVSSSGVCSIHGQPTTDIPVASSVGSFLHEPDAAVLAAKLTGVLATQCNVAAISPGNVYLTSDAAASHPALATFQIREQVPFDIKKLKSYFRDRRVGRLEIKRRGVDMRPEQLRKSLALAGEESATLIVTRLGKKVVAFVADRV